MNGLIPVVLVSWVYMWSREESIMNPNEIHVPLQDIHFNHQGEVMIGMTLWSWYGFTEMSIWS